jgi:hypothetical protein
MIAFFADPDGWDEYVYVYSSDRLPTLYKYAIRWSCWSGPSPLRIPGISAARVELRMSNNAEVVSFCSRERGL